MKHNVIAAFRSIHVKKNLGNSIDYIRVHSIYIHTAAKRIIFLLLVGHLLCISIHAQTTHSRRKEDYDVREFRSQTIDIASRATILQLKNIQGISVIDARADTSAVGF